MMHSLPGSRAARMLRWPVVSAAVAVGAVVALAAGASGSARPGPEPGGAPGAGRAGPAVAGAQALTWSVVPSPNRGSSYNDLYGVSCVSAADCMAVGTYEGSTGPFQTLIESWNGTSWSLVPSPNLGTGISQLSGVSCVSAADCMAVGYGSGGLQTLIESWNGTSWSVVPSPSPGTGSNQLASVSCVSAADCTAVGGTGTQTLVESWNGTSWSVVPSPNRAGSNALEDVSCVPAPAVSCAAVGLNDSASGKRRTTLIESWNGTSWSVVPSPNWGGTGRSALSGVSCVSAADCTAVGESVSLKRLATLIEAWNGTRWSVVPSPTRGNVGGGLGGVSCVSAADCTAAGVFEQVGFHTIIEAWNGTSWSVVPSPHLSDASNFGAMSCVPAAGCTAVGSTSSPGHGDRTLIESGPASG
jgi:hypothetical protein